MILLSSFKDIGIIDNFYRTFCFFPVPTVLVGTLTDNKQTSFEAYSLVSQYYIASKGYYAMLLCCNNSSNTAKGLLSNGKCSLNFIPDNRKYFKEAIRLGFPGDTSEEKMKDCIFTLEEGQMAKIYSGEEFPKVITESYKVFECDWMRELDKAQNDKVQYEYLPPYHDFNGITSQFGAHFILRVDKILMKEKYHNDIKSILLGNSSTAYGFHRYSSKNNWLPYCYNPIAKPKNNNVKIHE